MSRPRNLPDTLELVRPGDHLFLINHADEPVTVNGVTGTGVLDGTEYTGSATVPAEGVAVVQDAVVFIEDDDTGGIATSSRHAFQCPHIGPSAPRRHLTTVRRRWLGFSRAGGLRGP